MDSVCVLECSWRTKIYIRFSVYFMPNLSWPMDRMAPIAFMAKYALIAIYKLRSESYSTHLTLILIVFWINEQKKVGSFDEVRRSICLKWCDVLTEKRTRILEELQEAYDSLYPQTKVNNVDSWYSWFFVFLYIFCIFLLHFLGKIPKLFFWAYLADFLCIFMRIENIRSVNDSSLITIFGCYWNTSTTEAHWSLRIRIRSDWIRLIQKEEWVITSQYQCDVETHTKTELNWFIPYWLSRQISDDMVGRLLLPCDRGWFKYDYFFFFLRATSMKANL